MKTALLDVNVLTALLWPTHEHHDAAHRWFRSRRPARWATCPITQLGFVRVVSNPAFSRDALSPRKAVTLLAENLVHAGHRFWADALQAPAACKPFEGALQGHRQFTDAYLIALVRRRKGVIATFDRGLRGLAGEASEALIELVPTG